MTDVGDPIRAYEDALRDFHDRLQDLEVLRHKLQRATVALIRGWEHVSVEGLNLDFPRHVLESKSHRIIDAEDWPSAPLIATVLLAIHEAREKAIVAWSNVPPESRESLPEPPNK